MSRRRETARGGGMSAGFPCGAPASTHLTMVAISSSVSDRSLLKCWMPTFLSMNHGGISRSDDLLLDRPCPGPRLLVGQQRHRRDAPRPMADLTVLLEDGRDVLRERDLGLPCHRLPSVHRGRGHHDDHSERHRKDEPHTSPSLENSWPYSATSREKEVRSLYWGDRRRKMTPDAWLRLKRGEDAPSEASLAALCLASRCSAPRQEPIVRRGLTTRRPRVPQ